MSAIRRRTTMAEEIADELRALILAGQLKPGEYLESQKTLAEHYQVGLSTIRESIQLLAAVGLVESHPGKGTWVCGDALKTVFNSKDVKTRLGVLNADKVYEARLIIEVGLTRLAAERATPEDLEQIHQALQAMENGVENDNEFVKADIDFHFSVARAGHNPLLEQFYYLVRELLSEVISEMVMLPKVKEDLIQLQRSILQAISAHDPRKAQIEAQKHMDYIQNLLLLYS